MAYILELPTPIVSFTKEKQMSSISKSLIDRCGQEIIRTISQALQCSCSFNLLPLDEREKVLNDSSVAYLGARIMIHTHLTNAPFTKVHFENGLEEALNLAASANERPATLAAIGNPGNDITINGERYSLKTQAGKGTKFDSIHISKWMELGKNPNWNDDESVLSELGEEFIAHLNGYERTLVLRYLPGEKAKSVYQHYYELVEIPKNLLLMSRNGRLEMRHKSTQNPKPGYCYVEDEDGNSLFSLYFDGGGERKLQIKNIRKSSCLVHATWEFDV